MRIRQIEWPTVAMLVLCYGLWAVAGLVVWPIAPWVAIVIMAVMAGFHTSLQHEALHGHPTKNAAINEALVSLPLAVAFPYRRFKTIHLRHHCDESLTDPYDDPESWYLAEGDHAALSAPMRWLLAINNTFIGRLIIGPPLMVFGFLRDDARRLIADEQGVRRAWASHMVGLAILFVLVWGVMGIHPLLYILLIAYPGMSLIAIRTYCEHRWEQSPDGRTIIVEDSRILSWLFLNNNLHFVHHKLPRAPWYELPQLYRQKRNAWLAGNKTYVYRNYWDIFRAHALTAKEPVAHPALHRTGHRPKTARAGAAGAYGPASVAHRTGPGDSHAIPARPER